MEPRSSFAKRAIQQINVRASKLIRFGPLFSEYFNSPLIRVVLFLGITAYIASKTFLSIHNNWRTLEGFLILFLGLALIFRAKDKWSDVAGLSIIFFLVVSPLHWRFQGYDTDGFTIGGVLPTSDASGYFTGGTKIIYGEHISPFAARRPLFVTFLSVVLFIFGQDLVAALIGMAVVATISIFLLAREIRASLGIFPASLTTMVMVYCYAGRFTGKFLTEQIGIPLGILSLALLLRGLRIENFRLVTLGIFTMTLAQNARPGAMFVLPLLILWGSLWINNATFSIKSFLGLSATIASGFLLTYWVFTHVASPGSVPFGNFGSTIYGMATGYRGWRVWYAEYPGVADTEAMKIALQIILESPSVFIGAVVQAYKDFLDPRYFFSFLYLPKNHLVPVSYLLTGLTIAGVWRMLYTLSSPFSRMMLFVLTGILLSIPFAPPPDDGVRAMTATTSFLALIAGCGMVNLQLRHKTPDDVDIKPGIDITTYFSFMLIFITIAGWIFIRGILTIPGQGFSCAPAERAVTVVLSPNSYINVVRNSESSTSFLPEIRREDLLDNLSNFPQNYLWEAFRRIKPGQTIILGLNFLDDGAKSELIWLVVPTTSIQKFNGINSFCAVQTGNPELDKANFLIERSIDNAFIAP